MNKLIHIAVVSDENYAQHVGVMLASLLKNTSEPKNIVTHLLSDKIQSKTKNKLKEITSSFNSKIEFYNIDSSQFNNLSVRHISHTAYCKLLIPNVLIDLNKVIFIDCDMLVRQDIKELWEIDLSTIHLAAVRDYMAGIKDSFFEEDKISNNSRDYFNSGLMYINLMKWRESKISEKAIEFLKENSNKVVYHDQAALNRVIHSYGWYSLEPKWNQCPWYFRLSSNDLLFKDEELENAKNNPAIIHYAGPSKPWHYYQNADIADHPYRDEYGFYLQFTPWKNYVPSDRQLFNKKIIIFGAGEGGRKVKHRVEGLGHNVSYFIDNDSDKWNKVVHGIKVFSPKTLLKEKDGSFTIIVASFKLLEINEQLKEMGFLAGKHFIHSRGVRTYDCY